MEQLFKITSYEVRVCLFVFITTFPLITVVILAHYARREAAWERDSHNLLLKQPPALIIIT